MYAAQKGCSENGNVTTEAIGWAENAAIGIGLAARVRSMATTMFSKTYARTALPISSIPDRAW